MSKSIAAAIAIAAFAFAGQALAAGESAPSQAVVAQRVNFSDQAAVDAFYAKLARAAAEVCDSYSANPRVAQADRACAERALAEAVRKTNRPLLTARYERSAPRSAVTAYARGY